MRSDYLPEICNLMFPSRKCRPSAVQKFLDFFMEDRKDKALEGAIVWMQDDESEFCNLQPIMFFQNPSIQIQL